MGGVAGIVGQLELLCVVGVLVLSHHFDFVFFVSLPPSPHPTPIIFFIHACVAGEYDKIRVFVFSCLSGCCDFCCCCCWFFLFFKLTDSVRLSITFCSSGLELMLYFPENVMLLLLLLLLSWCLNLQTVSGTSVLSITFCSSGLELMLYFPENVMLLLMYWFIYIVCTVICCSSQQFSFIVWSWWRLWLCVKGCDCVFWMFNDFNLMGCFVCFV